MPKDLLVTACSDVRAGIKAQANIQELGIWLQKAVAVAMQRRSREGVEEAQIGGAYGEYFLEEDTGQGPRMLSNISIGLEEPSARFELWTQYKAIVDQLYPAT